MLSIDNRKFRPHQTLICMTAVQPIEWYTCIEYTNTTKQRKQYIENR